MTMPIVSTGDKFTDTFFKMWTESGLCEYYRAFTPEIHTLLIAGHMAHFLHTNGIETECNMTIDDAIEARWVEKLEEKGGAYFARWLHNYSSHADDLEEIDECITTKVCEMSPIEQIGYQISRLAVMCGVIDKLSEIHGTGGNLETMVNEYNHRVLDVVKSVYEDDKIDLMAYVITMYNTYEEWWKGRILLITDKFRPLEDSEMIIPVTD